MKYSVLALLAVFSSSALTEGAVKLLDCTVVQHCDAAGLCRPESGSIAFRMEPNELGAGGEGRYTLTYGDTSAEMQAISDSGPFLWNKDGERNALLPSSETDWLWHRLRLEPAPASEIRFLRCRFQQ